MLLISSSVFLSDIVLVNAKSFVCNLRLHGRHGEFYVAVNFCISGKILSLVLGAATFLGNSLLWVLLSRFVRQVHAGFSLVLVISLVRLLALSPLCLSFGGVSSWRFKVGMSRSPEASFPAPHSAVPTLASSATGSQFLSQGFSCSVPSLS